MSLEWTGPSRHRGEGRDASEAYTNARAAAKHAAWKRDLDSRHEREAKPMSDYLSPLQRLLMEHKGAAQEFKAITDNCHRAGWHKAKREGGNRFFAAACIAAAGWTTAIIIVLFR